MIKGVNRQMIEILDTGNPYFERALLVVQPGMDATDGNTLHTAAQEMLQNTDSCSHLKRQRWHALRDRALLILLSATGGAGLTLLIQWVCRI